jgi:hypothetical protein
MGNYECCDNNQISEEDPVTARVTKEEEIDCLTNIFDEIN